MSLKAKHWEKYGMQAELQIKLQAAENKPPMGTGQTTFSAQAVFLVQEAYNLIVAEYNLSKLPMCPEKGFFDFETAMCIGKFQDHFKLKRDMNANKETLHKMDELLLKMEVDKLNPTVKRLGNTMVGW